MNRPRHLPDGWYPSSAAGVMRQCERWQQETTGAADCSACIAPHAGWYFSGRLAFAAVARLRSDADTVVVVGGHLPEAAGILGAPEEGFETPVGSMESDSELLQALRRRIAVREDRSPENSVEVQLPLVRARFPRSKVLWLRAAPSEEAISLGEALFEASRELGRRVVVLGSTDLTHYGPAYGFMPHGEGEEAVRWTIEVSDKRLIEALLGMHEKTVLTIAATERSACSAGGAVAALSYANRQGAHRAELLGHYTSYDIRPDESFVGYCAVAYSG